MKKAKLTFYILHAYQKVPRKKYKRIAFYYIVKKYIRIILYYKKNYNKV
jgi:hypothetical protein